MLHDADVLIVGAGMVGASLAIALAPLGLRIAIIEAVPLKHDKQPSYDDRGITLAPSSSRILQQLGVWETVAAHATSITRIHISEQGRFGYTRLDASTLDRSELGHVVIARYLGQALLQRLSEYDNINLVCPVELRQFTPEQSGMRVEICESGEKRTLHAGLLVGADGSLSPVRRLASIGQKETDFKQTGIVSNVTTQQVNSGTAYERFTANGAVALLPTATNRSVLVNTVDSEDAQNWLQYADEEYIAQVMKRFGRRLGCIEKIGQRSTYPIKYVEALRQYQQSLVLIGNAAHTLHPNAAQGFNLGLRDVAGLRDAIQSGLEQHCAIYDISLLEDYVSARKADQTSIIRFTNGLASLFYNRNPLYAMARNLLMLLIDNVPQFKSQLMQTTMGLSGQQPQMARQL